MAKDKSKKINKSNGGEFAKPSEAPAGGDSWKFADDENDGGLFLITPLRKESVTTEKYGEKEVIVADIVALNEKKPAKSEEHEEVFVFGAWLQGSLRAFIGGDRRVLGRLDKAADRDSGRGYVWKLEDADDDDIEIAREYLATANPFATKVSKGADEKPAKKGKKSKSEPEPEPAKKSKKSKPEPEPEPAKKGKKKSKK